ncbi:hypothetical protein RRG08_019753 [Elysia crispata]|uniref:Uncharacterized protein n=1 Tax=Elysia crispata TaxID=231223 RepID=A0AAE1CTX3_9GAST|nr:hypothetical protein RRG08_019753 [Elysia crispata]
MLPFVYSCGARSGEESSSQIGEMGVSVVTHIAACTAGKKLSPRSPNLDYMATEDTGSLVCRKTLDRENNWAESGCPVSQHHFRLTFRTEGFDPPLIQEKTRENDKTVTHQPRCVSGNQLIVHRLYTAR